MAVWFPLNPQPPTRKRGSDREPAVVGPEHAQHAGMLGASPRLRLSGPLDGHRLPHALAVDHVVLVYTGTDRLAGDRSAPIARLAPGSAAAGKSGLTTAKKTRSSSLEPTA